MNQSPPELFPQRPMRSDYGRAPSYRTRRVLTVMIILALLGGGWIWLFGKPSLLMTHPGEIPTIKAEGTWKQKPEQPGGIDIPHQDVQVYQALDGNNAEKPQVEHLLPPPEVPEEAAPSPAPANNKPNNKASPPVAAVPQTETIAPMQTANDVPVIDVTPAATPVLTTVTPQPAQPSPPPAVVQPVKPAAAPPAAQPVKKKTVTAAPALTPTTTPKEEAATGPDRVVQFASVQSEAAAQDMISKMQTRYASFLGDTQLQVVQADLGAKGVYYRIRSQPVPESQADKICAAVKKLKEGCILVR